MWKRVLKTLKARLLTVKLGCMSCCGGTSGATIAASGFGGSAVPLVLLLLLGSGLVHPRSVSVSPRFENRCVISSKGFCVYLQTVLADLFYEGDERSQFGRLQTVAVIFVRLDPF